MSERLQVAGEEAEQFFLNPFFESVPTEDKSVQNNTKLFNVPGKN